MPMKRPRALRAAELLPRAAPRHHPVPPLASAAAPRAVIDQLADHPRRGVRGLTIFRPVDGLDEGPVILQKEVPIAPDDSVASLYFNKIFPLGGAALLEAADILSAKPPGW